jgi:hypothetical protein
MTAWLARLLLVQKLSRRATAQHPNATPEEMCGCAPRQLSGTEQQAALAALYILLLLHCWVPQQQPLLLLLLLTDYCSTTV